MDELLEMNTKELSRLEVMQRLAEKRMTQKEAASILGITCRQIKRLLQAYRSQGRRGWCQSSDENAGQIGVNRLK